MKFIQTIKRKVSHFFTAPVPVNPRMDIFYVGSEHSEYRRVEMIIQQAFPGAKVRDATDDGLGLDFRLSVEFGETGTDYRQYVRFLLQNSLAQMSFWFQMETQMHPQVLLPYVKAFKDANLPTTRTAS